MLALIIQPVAAGDGVTDGITLQQAIELALTNQPSLEKVEAEIEGAELRIEQTKSAFYPTVDIDAGYHYVDPVSAIEFDGNSLEVLPHHNYDAHIAANQMIYDFGKTKANIELAKSQALTAEQQKDVVKWTLSYFTAQTFYSVLYLDRSIEVEEQQLSTLNEDLEMTNSKLENGTATDYDVLSIKVRIAEEKDRELDLKSQKEKMLIRLRKLFGWAPDQPVELEGDLDLIPVVSPANLEMTFTQRPDYAVLQRQKDELLKNYDRQDALDLPSLSAGVMAGFKNGYQPDLNKALGNYSVGLQLHVPIFNGHRQRYQLEEIQANIKSVEAASSELQRTIQAEVEAANVDVETGMKKLETADLQIQQAEEQLRLAKVKYKNGVITNTDLLTAETSLTRARFRKVATTYNILLSQYDLRKAAGDKIWTE